VSLTADLDEPDKLGFCIDIKGFGSGINCDSLQAHSCKPTAADTQFEYHSATKALRSVNYDSNCDVTSSANDRACVVVSSDLVDGASLGLTLCDDSSEKQTFEAKQSNGGYELRAGGALTGLCLAVSDTTRIANSYVARNLIITDCLSTDTNLQIWTVNPTPHPPPTGLNIFEVGISRGFSDLVALLRRAELVETLSGSGPFTIFAPTDGAFAKVDLGVLECLQEPLYAKALSAILKYHVTNGEVASGDLQNEQKVTTLEGSNVTVTIMGSTVMINTATVTIPDVPAINGFFHEIDEVLIPTDNDDVDALIAGCATTIAPTSASAILGVAIPLIGMLAAVAGIM